MTISPDEYGRLLNEMIRDSNSENYCAYRPTNDLIFDINKAKILLASLERLKRSREVGDRLKHWKVVHVKTVKFEDVFMMVQDISHKRFSSWGACQRYTHTHHLHIQLV